MSISSVIIRPPICTYYDAAESLILDELLSDQPPEIPFSSLCGETEVYALSSQDSITSFSDEISHITEDMFERIEPPGLEEQLKFLSENISRNCQKGLLLSVGSTEPSPIVEPPGFFPEKISRKKKPRR